MNTMSYKGYTARVEYDERDNILVGRLIGIRSIISFHANTVAELRSEFEGAVVDYLAGCKEEGVKPEKPEPLNLAQQLRHLRRANEVARAAIAKGRHPFGALLVAADGETVLLEQANVDTVNHAESVLARVAAHRWDAQTLWGCTLVTTVEPCAMCAATQYWAHIGGLVYGLSEHRLLEMTGNHAENPTLDLPCRSVFAAGQKTMRVAGPLAEIEEEIAEVHRGFWQARG